MRKPIGPSFDGELRAAGLAGLAFSWGDDGELSLAGLSASQRDGVLAVYAAHDPTVAPVQPIDETRRLTLQAAINDALGDSSLPVSIRAVLSALKNHVARWNG
jgi:hypothetical protein